MKDKENEQNPYHVFYDHYLDTNACTECTGLIPNLVEHDHEEWVSYREIFDFVPRSAIPEDKEE